MSFAHTTQRKAEPFPTGFLMIRGSLLPLLCSSKVNTGNTVIHMEGMGAHSTAANKHTIKEGLLDEEDSVIYGILRLRDLRVLVHKV